MGIPANTSHSSFTTLSSVSPWDTQRRYSDLGDSCPARAKPPPPAPAVAAAPGPAGRHDCASRPGHPHAPVHPHYSAAGDDDDDDAAYAPSGGLYPAARSYSNLDADVADAAQFHHDHAAFAFPPFDPAVDTPWLFEPDAPPVPQHPPRPPPPASAAPSAPAAWLFDPPPPPPVPPGARDAPARAGEQLPDLVFTSGSEDERSFTGPGPAFAPSSGAPSRASGAPTAAQPRPGQRPGERPGQRLHFHHYHEHHHDHHHEHRHGGRPKRAGGGSSSGRSSATERPEGYPLPLGHGNGFPVLSRGRFLHRATTTYHVHASPNRRFRVHDVADRHGQPLFRLIPTPLCLRETKTLVDLRQPRARAPAVLRAHTIVFTTRARVVVHDAHGRAVLFLQKTSVVQSKRSIRGYVGGGTGGGSGADGGKSGTDDRKPQLVIREEERGRSYAFNDAKANEIAHLQRYRLPAQHASAKRKYAFKLNVTAGYDCALFIMAAMLMLDIWDD